MKYINQYFLSPIAIVVSLTILLLYILWIQLRPHWLAGKHYSKLSDWYES